MAFMFFQVTTACQGYCTNLKALSMKWQYIAWHIPLFHTNNQNVNRAWWKSGVVKKKKM